MATWTRFNLNQSIRVKMNPEGYAHWKQDADDFRASMNDRFKRAFPEKPLEWYQGQADEEGYVAFQGWHFMRLFGPLMVMANPLPFDLNVLIETQS